MEADRMPEGWSLSEARRIPRRLEDWSRRELLQAADRAWLGAAQALAAVPVRYLRAVLTMPEELRRINPRTAVTFYRLESPCDIEDTLRHLRDNSRMHEEAAARGRRVACSGWNGTELAFIGYADWGLLRGDGCAD